MKMNDILTKKSLFVVVVVVLFSIIFIYTKAYRRETFFVAYNNTNIPINKQETLDESDVNYLNTILNEYNISGFPDTKDTKDTDYIKYVGGLSIEVQDLISEQVITTLRIIFSKGTFKDDKLVIRRKTKTESESESEPFYDLYWKVVDNNIHCVFKMDITNIEKGWTRTFKIYLVGLSSTDVPLQGTFNIRPQGINIKTISLEEFSYLSFEGINQNDESQMYYQIENTLHLMDPYLTSGKDMKITDSMRQNFNNVLKKKYLT
jgi:hypothetical protein